MTDDNFAIVIEVRQRGTSRVRQRCVYAGGVRIPV